MGRKIKISRLTILLSALLFSLCWAMAIGEDPRIILIVSASVYLGMGAERFLQGR